MDTGALTVTQFFTMLLLDAEGLQNKIHSPTTLLISPWKTTEVWADFCN